MVEIMYRFFTADEISEIGNVSVYKITEYEKTLEKIYEDFKNQTIDFSLLFDSYMYRISLLRYLEKNGYKYIHDNLNELLEENSKIFDLNKENTNYSNDFKIKVIEFLTECKLINEENLVVLESAYTNGMNLQYDKSRGLTEEIIVRIKSLGFPVKITNVDGIKKDFIEVSNTDDTVMIKIKIPANYKEDVRTSEGISIYTNYKLETFSFSIECISMLNEKFFKKYDDFIKVCKSNYNEGKAYYEENDFREYLRICDNKFADDLYNTTKLDAKRLEVDEFDLFLFYNNVDIKLKQKNTQSEVIKIAEKEIISRKEEVIDLQKSKELELKEKQAQERLGILGDLKEEVQRKEQREKEQKVLEEIRKREYEKRLEEEEERIKRKIQIENEQKVLEEAKRREYEKNLEEERIKKEQERKVQEEEDSKGMFGKLKKVIKKLFK